MTKAEAKVISDAPPLSQESAQYSITLHHIVYRSREISSLPEIGHTMGFQVYLKDFLRADFISTANVMYVFWAGATLFADTAHHNLT